MAFLMDVAPYPSMHDVWPVAAIVGSVLIGGAVVAAAVVGIVYHVRKKKRQNP